MSMSVVDNIIGLMTGLDTLVTHAWGAGHWPEARRSVEDARHAPHRKRTGRLLSGDRGYQPRTASSLLSGPQGHADTPSAPVSLSPAPLRRRSFS